MKETLTAALLVFLFCFLGSCVEENCVREVTYNRATPVFDNLAKYRIPVFSTRIADIINPGMVIKKGNLIFLEDINLGIHILSLGGDDPPQHLSFIRIPGISEFMLTENTLIVNSYYDILSIDISIPNKAKLISRDEMAFPIPFYNEAGLPVIGFHLNQVTKRVDCHSPFYDNEIYFFDAHDQLIAPTTIPSFLTTQKPKINK